MPHPLMDDIEKLPAGERLQLVGDIWETLAANPDDVPVPEEDLAEVRRSIEEHRRDPSGAQYWDTVRAEISKRS